MSQRNGPPSWENWRKVGLTSGDQFQNAPGTKTNRFLFYCCLPCNKWYLQIEGSFDFGEQRGPFCHLRSLNRPWWAVRFLKGTFRGSPITLANNVYFPNTKHITFCQWVIRELQGFIIGLSHFWGGDFNVPLNPLVDTSSGKSCVTYKVLNKIKTLLHSLQLIDSWRFLHP